VKDSNVGADKEFSLTMSTYKNNSMYMSRQSGIGIVEVLVALVVVSLGVLGMASLQLTGMQHSSGGYNRSKALLYAENMATRMRTNRPAIDELLFDGYSSEATGCDTQPSPYCQASSAGAAAQACTAEQLAAFDSYTVACGEWGESGAEDGVVGTLPNGVLSIVCDLDPDDASSECTKSSTYTITVSWTEGQRVTSDMNDTITRRVQMRMRP